MQVLFRIPAPGLAFAADFSDVDRDIPLDSQSTIDMQELFDVQQAAVNVLLLIRNTNQLTFKGFPVHFELPEHSTIKQLKNVFYQALLLSKKPNQTKFARWDVMVYYESNGAQTRQTPAMILSRNASGIMNRRDKCALPSLCACHFNSLKTSNFTLKRQNFNLRSKTRNFRLQKTSITRTPNF